jgi:hypothetical protein
MLFRKPCAHLRNAFADIARNTRGFCGIPCSAIVLVDTLSIAHPQHEDAMPACPTRVDPLTVAHDACYAAGLTLRGMDLRTYDPVRSILAERFAPVARRCQGDPRRIATVIEPQLAQAVQDAFMRIEAEGRAAEGR